MIGRVRQNADAQPANPRTTKTMPIAPNGERPKGTVGNVTKEKESTNKSSDNNWDQRCHHQHQKPGREYWPNDWQQRSNTTEERADTRSGPDQSPNPTGAETLKSECRHRRPTSSLAYRHSAHVLVGAFHRGGGTTLSGREDATSSLGPNEAHGGSRRIPPMGYRLYDANPPHNFRLGKKGLQTLSIIGTWE